MSVKTLNFQKLVACIIFGAVVLALPMSWHYFSVRAYKENLVQRYIDFLVVRMRLSVSA